MALRLAVKSFDFCVQIPLKAFVFGFISSSQGSAGWEWTNSAFFWIENFPCT